MILHLQNFHAIFRRKGEMKVMQRIIVLMYIAEHLVILVTIGW